MSGSKKEEFKCFFTNDDAFEAIQAIKYALSKGKISDYCAGSLLAEICNNLLPDSDQVYNQKGDPESEKV